MTQTPALKLTAEEVVEFLEEVFPGSIENLTIEHVEPMHARIRMPFQPWRLRPGGTISGPSLMALADAAFWVALLAMIGREPLSVTSHLSIDFMRKPAPADVIALTTLHKLGRKLAVGDVLMYSDGEPMPCARASVTYAMPSTYKP